MKSQTLDPETKIEQYLQAGKTDKAFELIYKLAVLYAKKKNFVQSEAYRDRLYEIDSFALSRIIEVNEVIDTEKSKAVTTEDRELWSRFFEGLTATEASAFFLNLKEKVFESETIILHQGKPNDKLFLITQGQVKMLYSDPEKELFIGKRGSGDIFGEDTFFTVNVCTASVKTLTRVHARILDSNVWEKLKAAHNTLESNLKKVCSTGRSVSNILRQKGMDRRSYRRINLNTNVSFQILDSNASEATQRSIKAELWDISKGGLSFYFQSKNREAVRNLIGRNIGVRFALEVEGKSKAVALSGVVHGVQNHPLDEYSVHLQFGRKLSDTAIKTIELIANQT